MGGGTEIVEHQRDERSTMIDLAETKNTLWKDVTAYGDIRYCFNCGTCVAGCPSGAAHQKNFEDVQLFSEIEGLLADAQINEAWTAEKT